MSHVHAVLEHNTPEDYGHGHCDVADEAEGGSCAGGVGLGDVALEGEERWEEEHSASHAGGDLVADYFPEGGGGAVVGEEARSKDYEGGAGPDDFEVPAGSVDEEAGEETECCFG